MDPVSNLRAAIARTLANEVKAYDLARACVRFGLAEGTGDEAYGGKVRYVETRIEAKPLAELLTLGDAVLAAYEGYKLHAFELKEALRFARSGGRRRFTEITRRNLLDELELMGCLWGKLGLELFLSRLWPIDAMASHDPRHKTFAGEVWRHMVANEDWSTQHLLERLEVMQISDEAFIELLELLAHPSVRDGDEQEKWVGAINKHIQRDGFALVAADNMSGYPVFRARPLDAGVAATPKNLIFASTEGKPDIVLVDAIHNELRVVKNAEYCLFYDRQIPDSGLTWTALVEWWTEVRDDEQETAERSLYRRLERSLASPPEKILFRSYYVEGKALGPRLPALIPQVYVHYDPRTLKELYGEKRLPRQRMDFLLLLDHGRRIVIEVDGAQHYSRDGRPDPRLYAEMVEADRQLRLCGYDVYRFGGYELPESDAGRSTAQAFFARFFKRYQIG